MSTERAWFTTDEINEWADRYLAKQKEKIMTDEDDEFNRIEREASLRKAAVQATITKKEWIGLTDDERRAVRNSVAYNQFMTAGEYAELVQKATESFLKVKNEM